MKRRTLPFLLATLVLAAACSETTGDNRATTTSRAPTATTRQPTDTGGNAGSVAALEDAFVNVVAKVRPSVVEISTGAGLGSGVVYNDQGHIVTNAHV
ncbi:MAG: S1C family serine protease, partial [Actinomycetota bacterium]|nr:S1C family serine protease [Actinomycetota bacterium]